MRRSRDHDRPLASNRRAIDFYRRLGYVTVDRRTFGEDDCLVLKLTRAAWEAGADHK